MSLCDLTGEQTWSDLGLPLPTVSGYGYSVDTGLLRSSVDPSSIRQVRRYDTRPARVSLRFAPLGGAELRTLSAVLDRFGYGWFSLPLVTGMAGGLGPTPARVRLIGDYRVEAQTWEQWALTCEAEIETLDESCAFVAQGSAVYLGCIEAIAWFAYTLDWASIAAAWGDDTYWGRPN
jgi:hypothetical protein